jgi:UDP-glucose 4,6-dehydratase
MAGQIYNIGTDFEITNLEVARALLNAFSYEAQESTWITFVEDRNFNDVRYHIKSDKLCELGWKPEVAFEDGLRRTIAWYAKHKDHFENILSALVAHPQAGAVSHAVPTSFTA